MAQKLQIVSADADERDADWTKQSWDLPPYLSDEFLAMVPDVEAFRRGEAYKAAVDRGLIVDDEWVGEDPHAELARRLADRIEAEELKEGA